MLFLQIVYDIILPIFILISIGYFLDKRFDFSLDVLTKILLYLVMPAALFDTLTTSSLSDAYIRSAVIFSLMMIIALWLLGMFISKILGYEKKLARAFEHTVIFYNCGNYGFPISDLAFPGLGLAIQGIVFTVQNMVNFTFGLFLVSAGRFPVKQALLNTLRIPLIYAIFIAFIITYFNITLPGPMLVPIQYLSQALIPLALMTLGMQLAKTRLRNRISTSIVSVVCRLLIAPILAVGLVLLLGIEGAIAPILILSTSYPTAINSVLIAMEFDNEPEFVANAVFLSTVSSIITVAVVIYCLRLYNWQG